MYDKFETYRKNHKTNDVKNTELQKITKDRHGVLKAKRKMNKHKHHGAQELEEHYEDMLQAEYLIKKTGRNIDTRKKRLRSFIKNGHVK